MLTRISTGLFLALAMVTTTASAQMIVAHRGASADAPENTLAAFALAWEQKADAIEGDFYLTTDNQIVAIHDKSTKRTTGVALEVCNSDYIDLKNLDAGSWKHNKYAGECIPTIEQVVALIPDDRTFVLEIKDTDRIVSELAKKIREQKDFAALVPQRLKIISFDAKVIKACKEAMPEVTAIWLTSFKQDKKTGEMTPSIDSILKTMQEIQSDGLDCKASTHIDKKFVDQLRQARPDKPYEFHVWTVDDVEVAEHFIQLGVDSITTNRPAYLRENLELKELAE